MFFLDFEDKLENLNTEKEILIKSSKVKNIDISSKIKTIEGKELKELEKIYKNLSPWQIVKIARHPKRPKTLDSPVHEPTLKYDLNISVFINGLFCCTTYYFYL